MFEAPHGQRSSGRARLSSHIAGPCARRIASEPTDAIRSLIECMMLNPGAKYGEVHVMRHGELEAILGRVGTDAKNDDSPTAGAEGLEMSCELVAGTRVRPKHKFATVRA